MQVSFNSRTLLFPQKQYSDQEHFLVLSELGEFFPSPLCLKVTLELAYHMVVIHFHFVSTYQATPSINLSGFVYVHQGVKCCEWRKRLVSGSDDRGKGEIKRHTKYKEWAKTERKQGIRKRNEDRRTKNEEGEGAGYQRRAEAAAPGLEEQLVDHSWD